MNYVAQLIPAYKWIVWFFYLFVAFGVTVWAQLKIFSIRASTTAAQSWIEAYIKENPADTTFGLWQIFALIYAGFMWPLASSLFKLIIGIANASPDDKESRTLAKYITFVIIAGVTAILGLMAINYIGHSEYADRKIREDTEKAKSEGKRTSLSPEISLTIISQDTTNAPSSTLSLTETTKNHLSTAEVEKAEDDLSTKFFAWPSKMGEHLGTFGDFFGGVLNPILTFGTLIALAFTILLQRIQLNEARDEAKRTSTHEQTIAFETTFFNMLNLHAENAKNLTFDPSTIETGAPTKLGLLERIVYLGIGPPKTGVPVQGRAVFTEVLRSTQRGATKENPQKEVYRFLQNEHNDVLGHYFRHLYQILDHVDLFKINGTVVDREVRKRYSDILRAQLSSHELAVLILNCARGMVDGREFQDKLVDYEFLEHAPITLSPDKMHLSAKGIAAGNEPLFFEYFSSAQQDKKNSGKLEWNPGAFGKNKAVCEFLAEQHSKKWKWGCPTTDTRLKRKSAKSNETIARNDSTDTGF